MNNSGMNQVRPRIQVQDTDQLPGGWEQKLDENSNQ